MMFVVSLLAQNAVADASRGEQVYQRRCIACHSVDVSSVGPAHRGVVGRRAGTLAGYEYSDALKRSRVVWSATTLEQWLSGPEKLIPGQKMWFSLSDPAERRDVIAYLGTLRL